MPIKFTIESVKKEKALIDVSLHRLSDMLPENVPRSRSHLSRVFAGKTNPSIPCLSAIAAALGLSLDETLWRLKNKKFRIARGND